MKKIIAVKNTVASRITATVTRFARDNRGEGYLDMAMKIIPRSESMNWPSMWSATGILTMTAKS